jgi:hypothetical protein
LKSSFELVISRSMASFNPALKQQTERSPTRHATCRFKLGPTTQSGALDKVAIFGMIHAWQFQTIDATIDHDWPFRQWPWTAIK